MEQKTRRWLVAVAVGVVVLGGTLGAWGMLRKSPTADLKFQTAKVTRAHIESRVTATGTLSPLYTVDVGSQVSGRIQALNVDFNSPVHKGEVIARIDPRFFNSDVAKAKANLTAARAGVTRAKAALKDAGRQAKRAADLAARHLAAQSEADTAQANFDQAKAQLESAGASVAQARAALDQAQTNLGYTTIVSPIDGVVISRNVDVGQTVAASFQAPTLFSIAQDLKEMELHTSVAESDIGRIHQGMPVEFTVDAYPAETFKGTVKQVRYSPQTVQNVVTYDAVVTVKNPDLKLRPGMTADVSFVTDSKDGVVAVPNAALRFRPPPELEKALAAQAPEVGPAAAPRHRPRAAPAGEARNGGRHETGVAVEEAGRQGFARVLFKLGANGAPVPVRVRIGISDGKVTEIQSGLEPGDKVITGMEGPGANGNNRRRFGRILEEATMAAVIEARDLVKVYDAGEVQVRALAGVSLSIEAGASVAIMGASGSGKSTLMNILGCLDRPTSGSYRLADEKVEGLDKNRLAEIRNRFLGFVFQSFNLLPRTSALENVSLPLLYGGFSARERRSRSLEALGRVGLADRAAHHPSQLSGGQQQRVAIARALVTKPQVILADEPTGNLDSRTSIEVMALFQSLVEAGITVILVTHEHDIADYAGRVLELKDGRLIRDETRPAVAAVVPPLAVEGDAA